jgi:hypothetical protein
MALASVLFEKYHDAIHSQSIPRNNTFPNGEDFFPESG